MPRTYGHTGRNLLQLATAAGWCTQDSLTAYINAQLRRTGQEPISRALVASWETGRENMAADVLPLLLAHVAPHGVELLAALAGEAVPEALVVERPQDLADGEAPLVLAAGANGAIASLVSAIVGEEHPDSDGGRARTAGELTQRMRRIEDAESAVARLRARTEAELGAVGALRVAR